MTDTTDESRSGSKAGEPPDLDGRPAVDVESLVGYRRQQVLDELERADAAMAILTSPVSLRYAHPDARTATRFARRSWRALAQRRSRKDAVSDEQGQSG